MKKKNTFSFTPGPKLSISRKKALLASKKESFYIQSHLNNISMNKRKIQKQWVYYISDLHIDHKLGNNIKTRNEAFWQVDKIVERIVEGTWGEDEQLYDDDEIILIVCGDVSDHYEITLHFYKELSSCINGYIIAVPGNHEMWDAEHSLEEYEQSLAEDYITFLNDAILLIGEEKNRKISSTELEQYSIAELKQIGNEYENAIYGCLGGAGYNTEMNADDGIYCEAGISLDDEQEMAQRFQKSYNKIREAFSDKQVIVASHMPLRMWHPEEEYCTNWQYISGHTHCNYVYYENGYAIAREDNQGGYSNKNMYLKRFPLLTEIENPFSDFVDGLYKIDRNQYRDFYSYIGIEADMNRYGDILMIKKNGNYMFFLQIGKTLYILRGGQIIKTKQNINYYYDRIDEYVQITKNTFEKYFIYMQELSREIQEVGGDGRVHGNIIDIDFNNHLYINPFDGTVTPYLAKSTKNKTIYPSVENLLEDMLYTYEICYEKSSAIYKVKKSLMKNLKQMPLLSSLPVNTNIDKQFLIKSDKDLKANDLSYKYSRWFLTVQYLLERHTVREWFDLDDDVFSLTVADSFCLPSGDE